MATSITSMPTVAPSLCKSREHFWRDRAHLEHDGSCPRRGKNSLRPRIDALNGFIVGQAGEKHISSPRQFKNVLRNDAAMRSNGLRLSDIPVIDLELVASIEQPFCNPASHITQANESEFHLICCKTFHNVSVLCEMIEAVPILNMDGRFFSLHNP